MGKIERFKFEDDGMWPDKDGEYVRYVDVFEVLDNAFKAQILAKRITDSDSVE